MSWRQTLKIPLCNGLCSDHLALYCVQALLFLLFLYPRCIAIAWHCTASLQLNGASLAPLSSVFIITNVTTNYVIFSSTANADMDMLVMDKAMGLPCERYPDEIIRLRRYENECNGICNFRILCLLWVHMYFAEL